MESLQAEGLELSNRVLMIRPFRFRCNEMTAVNNYFQQQHSVEEQIHIRAIEQFDNLAAKLKQEGVEVIVVQDPGRNDTPDSVFPNNWVTFHQNGHILYPLFAENRRTERQIDIFESIPNSPRFKDYSPHQQASRFLQGTGSMVLDRKNRVVYAALSPRTHQALVLAFCQDNNYKPCLFKAYQSVGGSRQLIYHTNVMMWIGEGVCGICLESIDDPVERKKVQNSLIKSGKEIVKLSEAQINSFAGNCLMLKGKNILIVMSTTAFNVLEGDQKEILSKFGKIVHEELKTIEVYGGGSARCMLAEVF